MNSEGHMRFFNVEECGFYSFKNSQKVYGGGLSETFDSIYKWYQGRKLIATSPWARNARVNKPQCYIRDIYKDEQNEDFVVVFWKSSANAEGSILGIDEDSVNGSGEAVEISKSHYGSAKVWGIPCYYWVIPSQNIIVSIKFGNSQTDAMLVQEFIRDVMGLRIKTDQRFEVNETKKRGYKRFTYRDPNEPQVSLYYRFAMHQIETSTKNLSLARLAKNTKRILRRTVITTNFKDKRKWWTNIFESKEVFEAKGLKKAERKVEVSLDVKLDISGVQALLNEAAQNHMNKDSGDNIGFVDEKNVITWADTHILKSSLVLTPRAEHAASDIYDAIDKNRDKYLKLIADYKSSEELENTKLG